MKLIFNYPYYKQETLNKHLLFYPPYFSSSFSWWYLNPSYFSLCHLFPYLNHYHLFSSSYACCIMHYCLILKDLVMFEIMTNLYHSVFLLLVEILAWILLGMINCLLAMLLLLPELLILLCFLSSNQVDLAVMASSYLINKWVWFYGRFLSGFLSVFDEE